MTGTRPRRTAALAAATLALTLGACGTQAEDGPSTPTPAAATSPTPAPTEDETDVTHDDVPILTGIPEPSRPKATSLPGALPTGPVDDAVAQREDVQAAVAAEAERRGVPDDQVQIAGYAEVTWSDGSLGCPDPGMMYTQALVPGHQLVLEVDGELASYHAAQGKPFRYCASPVAPVGGAGGIPTSDM